LLVCSLHCSSINANVGGSIRQYQYNIFFEKAQKNKILKNREKLIENREKLIKNRVLEKNRGTFTIK